MIRLSLKHEELVKEMVWDMLMKADSLHICIMGESLYISKDWNSNY